MARKKRYTNPLPDHLPTPKEFEAYHWGIREGIIISPLGGPKQGEWKIGISNHWEPGKVKMSPESYTKDEVWSKVYEFYIHYHESYKNKKKPKE